MSSSVSKEAGFRIDKDVNEFGKIPLHGTPLAKADSLIASPQIVLAIVMDALIKARPISHHLTEKMINKLIAAKYHDIDTLANSSWQERVDSLKEGGYNRYREQCATNLGELAALVVGKYDGDLNKLLKQANGQRDEAAFLLKETKGMGDLAVESIFDNVQSVWPSIAPFIDSRSLNTAADIGIGTDLNLLYSAVEWNLVRMSLFTNGLSEVRLEKRQNAIESM